MSEYKLFEKTMGGSTWFLTPGNHDGYYMGLTSPITDEKTDVHMSDNAEMIRAFITQYYERDPVYSKGDPFNRLRKRLKMERVPLRIECFDNSNISGTEPVAGMVVFEEGKPKRSSYRKYRIKTVPKQDDYAYMAD